MAHPGVDLHIDDVEVLVGLPDVHVLIDGMDADALTVAELTSQEIASEPPKAADAPLAHHLDADGEEDDGDGGSDKQALPADGLGQCENQGEADGLSQATVGQTELVLEEEGDGPEAVDNLGQHQDPCRKNRRLGGGCGLTREGEASAK